MDGASAASATRKAEHLEVAATFRAVRDDRMEAREQLHGINELVGVRYSAVDTELTPVGRARTRGDTARISLREHTEYTFAGSKDKPYSYTVRHDLSFARADGGWALSKITTLDGPANLSTPEKLDPAELRAARQAAVPGRPRERSSPTRRRRRLQAPGCVRPRRTTTRRW
ncbi:hypothetical protein AB0P36_14795 [Streptomyces flavidovirens]|uniref:hypothetical protein n=1 Tax=Streptomyces flavidovirens TaxID=67298 RepID=UPI003441FB1A